MKKSYISFGALTSKPYAFTARSWELRNLETIDLFDSLGSNIRVDVRGSEIMRILPLNNESLNEEWISDKARYAYDGLNRERFINPMIKKNNLFVSVTWNEAFEFITHKFKLQQFQNFVINTGNFTDIEHIVSLNTFSKNLTKIIKPSINNFAKLNADLQEYYTIKSNIFHNIGNKVYILVGLNLRLENPVLNIKLRRLSLNSNILIAYIGSKYDYNINLLHLGNNLEILKKIVAGKHKICSIITNFLKKNSKNDKIQNQFKNKISLIFGNEIIQTNSHTSIIESIKQSSKASLFEYNSLELYSGKINLKEFGFFNKTTLIPNKQSFYYLLNVEKIPNYKENDFVVFQGHHNIKERIKFDVILPSTNWTEKSTLFLNCFGGVQKTKLIKLPPINVRDDWKITTLLEYLLLKTKNFDNTTNSSELLTKLHDKINLLSGNLMLLVNKYKIKNVQKFEYKNYNFTKKSIIINSMPFKNLISDYYSITSIEKASKIMRKCSNELNSTKTNFIK